MPWECAVPSKRDTNLLDINWDMDSIEGNNYLKSISQSFLDAPRDIACQQVIDFPMQLSNILDIYNIL